MTQFSIQKAEIKDIPWIIGELRDFSKFLQTKHDIYPGDETAETIVRNLVENHIVLLSKEERETTGIIAGLLTPHFLNPKYTTLVEMFWWVPEKYRGKRSGIKLLEAYTNIGKEVADIVTMTLECHSPVNNKTLEGFGYRQNEKNFILEV